MKNRETMYLVTDDALYVHEVVIGGGPGIGHEIFAVEDVEP
jgi:hypothetical protein